MYLWQIFQNYWRSRIIVVLSNSRMPYWRAELRQICDQSKSKYYTVCIIFRLPTNTRLVGLKDVLHRTRLPTWFYKIIHLMPECDANPQRIIWKFLKNLAKSAKSLEISKKLEIAKIYESSKSYWYTKSLQVLKKSQKPWQNLRDLDYFRVICSSLSWRGWSVLMV